MAHIHLEDGALSPAWVLFWWAVAAAIIAFTLLWMRREPASVKRLTIGAMCAAVGIAAFMVTIPVFGGIHLNLTPLIGILAGPAVGGIAVLVMNLFSAAVGHGGWGVIGVNVVINLIEVLIGYYAYRTVRVSLRAGRFTSGFSATTLALVISAVIVVVIIAVAGVQDSHLEEEETAHNLAFIAVANIVMGVVEGFITAYILTFIGKVKPDLLTEVERPRKEEAPPPSTA
jgi:cobalt/nickel transport system permease protein